MGTRSSQSQFVFPVVEDGKVACTLVPPDTCSDYRAACRLFQGEVGKEVARMIPVRVRAELAASHGPLLLLGSLTNHSILAELRRQWGLDSSRLGVEGFALRAGTRNGRPILAVVGQTPLAVQYGVQHLVDAAFVPQGRTLSLQGTEVECWPDFVYRSAYVVNPWGNAANNSPEGWKAVIDKFAANGLNRVWFNICGLYRSSSMPEVFWSAQDRFARLGGGDYMWGYRDSPMDSNDAIGELIEHAHRRGLKMHLLTGLFEWHYTFATRDNPEIRSACPSFPASRDYSTRYLQELLDTFPEADGLLLEVRGEDGGCTCELCSKVIDPDGSRQFGESLAGYLKELFPLLWARRPDLELVITAGYRNASMDANYLEKIAAINDPRFTVWLCQPQPGGMPARGGTSRPPRQYFSNAVVWVPAARISFQSIMDRCRQAAAEGMVGVVTECDSGFYQPVNLWHDYDLPYGGEDLCFQVKQFVFKLMSWDKDLTMEDVTRAVHRKFFGPGVPDDMARVLMDLVEAVQSISEAFVIRYYALKGGRGTAFDEYIESGKTRAYWQSMLQALRNREDFWPSLPGLVTSIEPKIASCEVGASRRARRTLAAMREILLDIRGPIIGPERILSPTVPPSEKDWAPIMALQREAKDWIKRIEAGLAKRKD